MSSAQTYDNIKISSWHNILFNRGHSSTVSPLTRPSFTISRCVPLLHHVVKCALGDGTALHAHSSYIDCLPYTCYTSYMTITITMTSKGQFTLPAEVRKAMALQKRGDKLMLDFSPASQQVVFSRPVSFADIQANAKRYIKPGTTPLTDVDALYNTREAQR